MMSTYSFHTADRAPLKAFKPVQPGIVQATSNTAGTYTTATTTFSEAIAQTMSFVPVSGSTAQVLDDEGLWDKLFAESQELIDTMADEALAEHLAGLTEELDLDNDFDTL